MKFPVKEILGRRDVAGAYAMSGSRLECCMYQVGEELTLAHYVCIV
jgi:hypothetical protein